MSRFQTAINAQLGRLAASREEFAKAWLVRLIERSSLEEVDALPVTWFARQLPDLIAGILGAAGEEPFELGPDQRELARQLGAIREGASAAAELSRDIGELHALLVAGLRSEVPEAESAGFRQATEQLALRFGLLQGAAIEALIEARDPGAGADPLTGMADAGGLRDAIERLIDLHRRYGAPFALLVLDVDGLDRINAAKGRPAGDAALTEVAKSIALQIRSVDLAFRLEGDEFCVLAEHQTASTAEILATRLGKAVEEIEIPGGLPISASIGVVSCPRHAEDAEVLLEFADTALYRAKAAGERVVVATSRNGNTEE